VYTVLWVRNSSSKQSRLNYWQFYSAYSRIPPHGPRLCFCTLLRLEMGFGEPPPSKWPKEACNGLHCGSRHRTVISPCASENFAWTCMHCKKIAWQLSARKVCKAPCVCCSVGARVLRSTHAPCASNTGAGSSVSF
jgi:hypothetical protein